MSEHTFHCYRSSQVIGGWCLITFDRKMRITIRSELNSILESARNPNWAAFESIAVSPDLTVFVDRCGEPLAIDESETMVNAMRLASWKRRYASTDASDVPSHALTRALEASVTKLQARGRG